MLHYVYILQSQTSGKYYKGYTTDYKKRLLEHNEGLSRWTAGKGPWQLVYLETCETKTAALKREKMLKRQHHAYLDWLIGQEINEVSGVG
ncbi:MAG: hypothetical protein DHS20C18_55750 [Saprospiraceae bacterium]|nr:MAG: hypothetical protein DHS20C18_55750 [Saprospiraceae bacterium]